MNTLFFTHQHPRSTKTLRINYGLEGMKYIVQVYEVRSMDTERKKVYPLNTNTSLNRKCWNTFIISRRIWEIRVGGREKLQCFLRPLFWGVKTQMQNWDLSLSERIPFDLSGGSCKVVFILLSIFENQDTLTLKYPTLYQTIIDS